MVLDCGPRCKESRTMYQLEVEREWDGVRLWTQMQRKQDDVPTGGGEGVGWCQIVDPDVVMILRVDCSYVTVPRDHGSK